MGSLNKIAKAVSKGFTKVEPGKQEALYQYALPYKLNPKIAAAGVAGIGALSFGNVSWKNNTKGIMGETSVGQLSGLTASGSETVSPLIKQMQEGKYNPERIENNFSNHGADGDIVFALHNMR